MRHRPTVARLAALSFTLATLPAFGFSRADMWWDPNESGWGLNLIQQNTRLFATLFVYGADSRATFYVASDVTCSQSGNGNGTCTGDLFQTSGPWLGGTFNPALVEARKVGTFSFFTVSSTTATLTYSVDGVVVNKSISRFNLTPRPINGTYHGAQVLTTSQCTNTASNGADPPAYYNVVVTASPDNAASGALTLRETFVTAAPPVVCNHLGTYAQSGSIYRFSTTFTCDNGVTGTHSAFAVEFSQAGMRGVLGNTYSGTLLAGCRKDGTFVGTRAGLSNIQ